MIKISIHKQLNPVGVTPHLDLDLEIEEGENIGIVGPSGSGKTTLLKILAGLTTPDSGEVIFGDQTWYHSDKNINQPPKKGLSGLSSRTMLSSQI